MRIPVYTLVVVLAAVCIAGVLHAAESAAVPTVTFAAPTNGATIQGGQVDVTVSFGSDDKHPVSKVQVFLDGKPASERVYETPLAQGTCSFKWDTVRSPNGKHKLDIQIFSNTEYLAMASCTVTVSNQPRDLVAPKVALISPKEGDTVSGVTPVTIEASDNSGREPLVSVCIDKSVRCIKNRGPYTYEWDTTRDENGPHSIEVAAADDLYNRAGVKPISVTVRNPGKPMPVIGRETTAVPEAADVLSRSIPVLPNLPSTTATPRQSIKRSGAAEQEYARTVPEPGSVAAEKFEVEHTAAPVANLPSLSARVLESGVPHVELKESPAPVPEEKAASAGIAKAADSPEPTPNRTAALDTSTSGPTAAPVLMAGLAEADQVRPSVRADYRLAVPAIPAARAAAKVVARASSALRGTEYVVRPGDSVIRLAKRFGVSAQAIIEVNAIQDPRIIRIGDKLRIPANAKMIAIRPVFEDAGGTLIWDSDERSVRAICAQNDVTLRIGRAEAAVNGAPVAMERPAVVRSGRTLVCESFVTETLGMAAPGR
ncbi:MAG TPA: Ig-like domain-containing protein [Armatimonadota bacterium]|nr:Ig-like domain-containing protein [Armatimonadota bacterium]